MAALCKDCPIDDMVRQISEVLPGAKVMAIQQVVKSRMEMLAQFKHFSSGISGAILFVGGLVVLVTMMGSVRERTDEIGIFRAIGFRRGHIMRIVFLPADEPTGNLDTKNSGEIMQMFRRLNAGGMTIIMVTHSAECAGHARRVMKVSDGRLLEDRVVAEAGLRMAS